MLEPIDTLHRTLATWLVEEELLLRDTADLLVPAALTARLDRWRARLLAYERLERALGRAAATPRQEPPTPELVASGLRLAS
jgi:hypothetical protein